MIYEGHAAACDALWAIGLEVTELGLRQADFNGEVTAHHLDFSTRASLAHKPSGVSHFTMLPYNATPHEIYEGLRKSLMFVLDKLTEPT